MDATTTTAPWFCGTAAQALEYARTHGIVGKLVRRTRNGRELRAYRIDADPAAPAWQILAATTEHVI